MSRVGDLSGPSHMHLASHVCLCMLSMSLIVVSANVDALDSYVHVQPIRPELGRLAHSPSNVASPRMGMPASGLPRNRSLSGCSDRPNLDLLPSAYAILAHGPIASFFLPGRRLVSPCMSSSFRSVVILSYIRNRFVQLSYTHAIPQCSLWCTLPPIYHISPIATYAPSKPSLIKSYYYTRVHDDTPIKPSTPSDAQRTSRTPGHALHPLPRLTLSCAVLCVPLCPLVCAIIG